MHIGPCYGNALWTAASRPHFRSFPLIPLNHEESIHAFRKWI